MSFKKTENIKKFKSKATLDTLLQNNFSLHKTRILFQTFIIFKGFRKLWDTSSEIVTYFNVSDSDDIIKNALFLTLLNSGTFIVNLPCAMLDLYVRQSRESEQRITITSVVLGHSITQTLLFPFVCLFIVAFKLGGDNTLLWAFGFAEFQLFTDLFNVEVTRPLPLCELRQEIEKLAKNYKFPLQEVLVSKRINGQRLVCLQGFPRAKDIVLSEKLTRGNLSSEEQLFTIEEINALVLREMSHWSRGHSYIYFFANQVNLILCELIINNST